MFGRKITTVIGLAAALLVATAGLGMAKDWKKIRIGSEGAYAPFNFFDASGQLVGFDIDIGRALCKKIGAECVFVAQDWEGMIPALVAGKYDVILASMSITDERKKIVSFTDPYYKAALIHVALKGSNFKELTADALAGKSIGALAGSTQADYITAAYPKSDIRLYRTQDEVNLDLISGRIDLQVSDMLPMVDWVEKTEDGKCCELVGKPITDAKYAGDGTGMAVRKEDNDLRKLLNKALSGIIADGTYKKINDKYFSINILTMQ